MAGHVDYRIQIQECRIRRDLCLENQMLHLTKHTGGLENHTHMFPWVPCYVQLKPSPQVYHH
jgi:hypothetical protein